MVGFTRFVCGVGVVFALFFCADYAPALDTEFHGRVQSTFVLRDYTGFQYGFMDELRGIQWRNELKFDITAKPEYEGFPSLRMEKLFISYRGAYDAIFDIRSDRFKGDGTWERPGLRDKGPADWELGKDDIETENDLREGFVDIVGESAEHRLLLRLGRQIVQWGEADGFNVVNIVNPMDNSTLLFFEMPEDLATPLWMLRMNYSHGNVGPLHSVGLEVLLVPDIRPWQIAPADDAINTKSVAPYQFGLQQLEARPLNEFSTTKVLDMIVEVAQENGLSLGGALNLIEDRIHPESGATIDDLIATLTGPEQLLTLKKIEELGLVGSESGHYQWRQHVPGSSLKNTEYGVSLEAGYGSFVGHLYYYHGWQNFLGAEWHELLVPGDIHLTYPEQDMYGVSFNVFLPFVNGVLRGEGCMINKMYLLNVEGMAEGALGTLLGLPPGATGLTAHNVYYGLIGFDKDMWIRWLNPNKMIGTSWQVYQRHISSWDYSVDYRLFYKDDNYRITGYFYTDYVHGRIHPEVMLMYDPEGVWMTMASVKYSRDGRLFYKLTQISFWGNRGGTNGVVGGSITDFTQPFDLIPVSEVSLRVGYNW